MDRKSALTGGPASAGRPVPLGPEERRRRLMVVGEPARSCLVLLGVPHSGLSLCSQILQALGMDMAEPSGSRPGVSSQSSDWHERICAVFASGGQTSLYDMPLPAAWWMDDRLSPVLDDMSAFLRTRKEAGPSIGIGGPQTAFLLPLWLRAFENLSLTPNLVLCLRNPAHVVPSLAESDGLSIAHGEYRWFSAMIGIFDSLTKHEVCLVEYENWSRDPQANVKRLQDFLGLDQPWSRGDLDAAIAGIIDRSRSHAGAMTGETGHPWVRSLYEAAKRWPMDPAARDAIASMSGQFALYRRLSRPLEEGSDQSRAATDDRRHLHSGEAAPELAVLRTRLTEREAALAEARRTAAATSEQLRRALDQRAESDAALARAQQEAELQAGKVQDAEAKLAEREAALADALRRLREAPPRGQGARNALDGIGRPALWDRLRAALGLPRRARREAADRAAETMAALREALAEQETALGDAAGQIETFASWLDEADAERAESTATLLRLHRDAADRETAARAAQAELEALRDELAARSAAFVEAAERAEEMTARRDEAETELTACQHALAELQSETAERDAALADTTERAKEMAARLATAQAEHEAVVAELTTQSEETESRLQRALTERAGTDAAYARLQQEAAESERALQLLEAERAALDEQLAQRQAAFAEAAERAEEAASRLTAAEAARAALHDRLAQRETAFAEAAERAQETASRLAAAEADLGQRNAALTAAEEALDERDRMAQEARAELISLQGELAFCRSEIVRVEQAAANWDATAAAAEGELAVLRDEMAAHEAAAADAAAQAAEALASLKAIEDKLARREAAIGTLEWQLSEREAALAEADGRISETAANLAAARAELAERNAALAIAERAAGERAAAAEAGRADAAPLRAERDLGSHPVGSGPAVQTTGIEAARSRPTRPISPQSDGIIGFDDTPLRPPRVSAASA